MPWLFPSAPSRATSSFLSFPVFLICLVALATQIGCDRVAGFTAGDPSASPDGAGVDVDRGVDGLQREIGPGEAGILDGVPSEGVTPTCDNTACPLGCINGVCRTLVTSNVASRGPDCGAYTVAPGDVVRVNTTTCIFDSVPIPGCLTPSAEVQKSGGYEACVLRFGKLLALRGEIRAQGDRPLIIISDVIRFSGKIDVSANGPNPGAGGARGGGDGAKLTGGEDGFSGAGKAGGPEAGHSSPCASDPNTDDNGGGGGGLGSLGAPGGTELGCTSPGAGGTRSTNLSLAPLYGGSGGASATNNVADPQIPYARGGAGGGAVQLSARLKLVLDGGVIIAGGGGGESGDGFGFSKPTQRAGGGGGSGGGVLIEAPVIEVSALGGAIYTGGGGGGAGVVSVDPAPVRGDDGSTVPARGASVPAAADSGGTGGDGAFVAPAARGVDDRDAAGGGGGGVGLVRINSAAQIDPCQTGVTCIGRVSTGVVSGTGGLAGP